MKDRITALEASFTEALAAAHSEGELEALRIAYLGKKGHIATLMQSLRDVADKKTAGQMINAFKCEVEGKLAEAAEALEKAAIEAQIRSAKKYNPTLRRKCECGSYHPITLATRDAEEVFRTMGFTIEDYSEVVDDYECFESLNIPKHHPARDMQDTYYLENGQLLKTQTSAAQNAIMKKYGAPLRAIFPGRCFRNESTDACHENTFFQMEGMMIDENISISNLIYFMKTMLSAVFKRDLKVRLRPGFFPFVEPGFELDINCLICGGEGCPSCKNSGWLELCPCGMIHPNVLRDGGIDTEKYTGFAFGLGLTRLAMMKYGIKDIRDFNSGELSVLSQFKSN
ncbi:MAG: phenylalanine--tRNA ligase subunit alpha [Clostridia bacterium]|nr:phenylalanine--tRNA ligase subunit alpha [Clostridia bacterium]